MDAVEHDTVLNLILADADIGFIMLVAETSESETFVGHTHLSQSPHPWGRFCLLLF